MSQENSMSCPIVPLARKLTDNGTKPLNEDGVKQLVALAEKPRSGCGQKDLREVYKRYKNVAVPQAKLDLILAAFAPRSKNPQGRNRPLFKKFLLSDVLKTRHGALVPRPFQAYSGEISGLYGTINLEVLKTHYLKNSGRVPFETILPDGTRAGVAGIYVNRVDDSVCNPYNEVLIFALTVPENTPVEKRTLPYANGFTTILPEFLGAKNFAIQLILDDQKCLDLGIQDLATPKVWGNFKMTMTPATHDFKITDKNKKPLLSGGYKRDASPAAQKAMIHGLAIAMGKTEFPKGDQEVEEMLRQLPDNVHHPIETRLDNKSPLFTWDWVTDVKGMMNDVDGKASLKFEKDSPLGAKLGQLGFVPRMSYFAPDLSAAVTDVKPANPGK